MGVMNLEMMLSDASLTRTTKEITGFSTFMELLDAKGGYRPSLNASKPECLALADAYDLAQRLRNDGRRAHRYYA